MDVNTLYEILPAIGFSIVIMYFRKKKDQSAWKGTVTKIIEVILSSGVYSEYNTNFKDYVDIYYRTNSGKEFPETGQVGK